MHFFAISGTRWLSPAPVADRKRIFYNAVSPE
jgi:hypothetical protein